MWNCTAPWILFPCVQRSGAASTVPRTANSPSLMPVGPREDLHRGTPRPRPHRSRTSTQTHPPTREGTLLWTPSWGGSTSPTRGTELGCETGEGGRSSLRNIPHPPHTLCSYLRERERERERERASNGSEVERECSECLSLVFFIFCFVSPSELNNMRKRRSWHSRT